MHNLFKFEMFMGWEARGETRVRWREENEVPREEGYIAYSLVGLP
jgi:hypothetical protein